MQTLVQRQQIESNGKAECATEVNVSISVGRIVEQRNSNAKFMALI